MASLPVLSSTVAGGAVAFNSSSSSSSSSSSCFVRRPSSVVFCAVSKPATADAGTRRPRGIMKAKPVSPAMHEFLGVPEMARTQALKHIWAYIKQHNLQDPEDKKIIICDDKLKKIFVGKERVGFLEISKLLNPHFLKE